MTFRAGTAEQTVIGGDAPVAVVVKMRNQWVIEYHGIVAKLKQDSAGAEAHRGALATAKCLRGDVAGHEEEERAEQFPSEIKQQKWVGWVRKE